MVFSSLVFLVAFLPLSVIGYYVIDQRLKNIFLLLLSVLFYVWGAAVSFPILLASILINYLFALAIEALRNKKRAQKAIMIGMLVINIGLLILYKYLVFVLNALNHFSFISLHAPHWALPLGISFFTFSAISYVLDVYFGAEKAERNILNVALFILFFPKLISGPIVKWGDFKKQLTGRVFSVSQMSDGVSRFIVGLAKKAIISDTIAPLVDMVFEQPNFSANSIIISWFAILAFLLQLYFDFSGYSDMAIGLGKMFGFELDENFNYPYTSKRIAEFWAKWHMTLGTWIKHYIYTPLFRSLSKKNKRTGKKRSVKQCDYIALFVSWLIIGLWHGAGYKFLVYGMFYFAFILLERMYDDFRKRRRLTGENIFTRTVSHIYFLLVIFVGQMVFRANSLKDAVHYFLSMFGLNRNPVANDIDLFYIGQYWLIMLSGILFSLPVVPVISKKLNSVCPKAVFIGSKIGLAMLLIVSISFCVGSSYKAFIYFNF